MRRTGFAFFIAVAVCLLAAPAAQAAPITVSTGDLGLNVIEDAGRFDAFLSASTPSNTLPASILVKYGLWNDPAVSVSVFFNDAPVGSFVAAVGYVSPGPAFAPFDVTGLLRDGWNKVTLDGFGLNYGDYIIGQVDLNYDNAPGQPPHVPEPASLILLGSGLAGAALRRRLG